MSNAPHLRDADSVVNRRLKQKRRSLLRRVLERVAPVCAYCGKSFRTHPSRRTVDHVQPQSRGGTDEPDNLVLACSDCNLVKGDRTPEEWAADILAARCRTAQHAVAELPEAEKPELRQIVADALCWSDRDDYMRIRLLETVEGLLK